MLVKKFAHVFSPTASALHTKDQQATLQELMMQGTRYGLYVSLPVVLVLTVFGQTLLRLWMGEAYAHGWVLAILAIGHVAVFSQETTYQILLGMGRHGVPALVTFAAALLAATLAIISVGWLQWGLIGAAVALVLPLTITYGIFLPLYACRVLGIGFWQYWLASSRGPFYAAVPFATCLVLTRWSWSDGSVGALVFGLGIGSAVLAVIYWQYVIPPSMRHSVTRFVGIALLGRSRATSGNESMLTPKPLRRNKNSTSVKMRQ
jgi:O-antigen/teichoic acid export membrane protein